MLTLKIKLLVTLPGKKKNSGIGETFNVRQANYEKTIGKSREQKRGVLFHRGKGSVRRAVVNKISIGLKDEFKV